LGLSRYIFIGWPSQAFNHQLVEGTGEAVLYREKEDLLNDIKSRYYALMITTSFFPQIFARGTTIR